MIIYDESIFSANDSHQKIWILESHNILCFKKKTRVLYYLTFFFYDYGLIYYFFFLNNNKNWPVLAYSLKLQLILSIIK